MISPEAILLWFMSSASASWPYSPPDPALQRRRYEGSDLVFIGKVVRLPCCDKGEHASDKTYRDLGLARIDIPIKGLPSGEVIFNYQSGIIDIQPECCREGATYIFFLKSIKGKDWYTFVGGVNSIIEVEQ